MPDQTSMPASEVTPRSGRNSGMIGLRKLNAMVMTNWMPTMAHRVTCQLEAVVSAGADGSVDLSSNPLFRRLRGGLVGEQRHHLVGEAPHALAPAFASARAATVDQYVADADA